VPLLPLQLVDMSIPLPGAKGRLLEPMLESQWLGSIGLWYPPTLVLVVLRRLVTETVTFAAIARGARSQAAPRDRAALQAA